MNRLDDTREFTPNGRNIVIAAKRLRDAKDDELRLIVRRDPGMIREVAMGLLLEIARTEARAIAPGHTDLMVTPESLDDYLAENPPPQS